MAIKKRKSTKTSLKQKTSKKSKMPKAQKGSTKKLKIAAPAGKLSTPKKPYTKGEFLQTLAEQCGLAKKEVNNLLETMGNIIELHLKSGGPGMFTLPGLVKIVVVKKPATKARKGISPFTGEEMMFKAKPARKVAKVRALKKLKAMV